MGQKQTTSTAVFYSVDITECRTCNRLTNLNFKVIGSKLSIKACCQEHANKIFNQHKNRFNH